jgi:transcriptional regulator with GAF, ATPase, and Fis domain
MAREQLLSETLVALADTLVDDYDVIDFMQTLSERCVELLDVTAAGIMLADSEGKLRHIACSSEEMRLVELFELQLEEGPCLDAYTDAAPIVSGSLADAEQRWPQFAAYASQNGFRAMSAIPMRLRANVIGALNLFSTQERILARDDVVVAQALADIATIGNIHERSIRDTRTLASQLQGALDSRIIIEQAKGIVAERRRVSVDEAFVQLRTFSRNHNRRLTETAREIVAGSLPIDVLTG